MDRVSTWIMRQAGRDVSRSFVQNEKKLSRYDDAIESGRLPVHKGFRRRRDDEVRRDLIQNLMCKSVVDRTRLERRVRH